MKGYIDEEYILQKLEVFKIEVDWLIRHDLDCLDKEQKKEFETRVRIAKADLNSIDTELSRTLCRLLDE